MQIIVRIVDSVLTLNSLSNVIQILLSLAQSHLTLKNIVLTVLADLVVLLTQCRDLLVEVLLIVCVKLVMGVEISTSKAQRRGKENHCGNSSGVNHYRRAPSILSQMVPLTLKSSRTEASSPLTNIRWLMSVSSPKMPKSTKLSVPSLERTQPVTAP